MKASEIIISNYDRIKQEMIDLYKTVVSCNGRIQYSLYIWEDGEFERLEEPQGGNGWLKAKQYEPRQLFYITYIDVGPGFSIWDYCEDGRPDDPKEAEELESDIIDWLVCEYEANIDDVLDGIIRDKKEIEEIEEEL